MDSQKVDLFLAANQKFFSPTQILTIKDRLLALDDDKFTLINALDYKDPTMMIIVSVFAGSLGIDRFIARRHRLRRAQAPHVWWLRHPDDHRLVQHSGSDSQPELHQAPADHQLSPPVG